MISLQASTADAGSCFASNWQAYCTVYAIEIPLFLTRGFSLCFCLLLIGHANVRNRNAGNAEFPAFLNH